MPRVAITAHSNSIRVNQGTRDEQHRLMICAAVTILLLGIAPPGPGSAPALGGTPAEARKWEPCEIAFAGPYSNEATASPNPFLDYRLQVTFTAPSGKALYKRLRGISSAQEQRIVEQLQSDKAAELKNLLRELMSAA